MAKKRRQKIEKKDDYVFKEPEFEKSEFIQKEIRTAKATFVACGYAILMALVSLGFLILLEDFRVGAIIGIFGTGGLYFIFNMVKIDINEFEKKNWAGVIAVYIFTWLMLAILFSNPPITDLAEPTIKEIRIEYAVDDGNGTKWELVTTNTDGDIAIKLNQSYRIHAEIWDNGDLKTGSIKCELLSPGGQFLSTKLVNIEESEYGFEFMFFDAGTATGTYEYFITADDSKGNSAEKTGYVILE